MFFSTHMARYYIFPITYFTMVCIQIMNQRQSCESGYSKAIFVVSYHSSSNACQFEMNEFQEIVLSISLFFEIRLLLSLWLVCFQALFYELERFWFVWNINTTYFTQTANNFGLLLLNHQSKTRKLFQYIRMVRNTYNLI